MVKPDFEYSFSWRKDPQSCLVPRGARTARWRGHARTAIEEPDKVVKPEFRFMPSPSSSPRAPGDQTRWRILAPSKRIFKIRSTTLKRGSRATGKPGFLYMVQSKHLGCISPRVCESTPMSKQYDFPKGRFLITSPLSLN